MELIIDAWTFDAGVQVESAEEFAREMSQRVEESWDSGADVVLFPEYAWMGLEPFCSNQGPTAVAAFFWQETWPNLRQQLSKSGKCAVLGSAPWLAPDGRLLNRAPILTDGLEIFQDKLWMTPWEVEFSGGEGLHTFMLGEFRLAVLICLDIEVPENAVALRGSGVDAILVPSATETMLGSERIARCASARAVELGCAVVVSHLVGRGPSDMIDDNVGRVAYYLPSQASFTEQPRMAEGDLLHSSFRKMRVTVDGEALRAARKNVSETNPSLLPAGPVRLLR